jgi:hypothetical protein
MALRDGVAFDFSAMTAVGTASGDLAQAKGQAALRPF